MTEHCGTVLIGVLIEDDAGGRACRAGLTRQMLRQAIDLARVAPDDGPIVDATSVPCFRRAARVPKIANRFRTRLAN